jgi:hypothetical protein
MSNYLLYRKYADPCSLVIPYVTCLIEILVIYVTTLPVSRAMQRRGLLAGYLFFLQLSVSRMSSVDGRMNSEL